MKLGLIETFVKYAARKNNTLTEEDLSLFEKRYNVYEAEMDEVIGNTYGTIRMVLER